MLLRTTLVHTYYGMTVDNTFGRTVPDGTVPQDEADALAAALASSAWLAGRSNQISLVEVRVEDDTPGVAATGEVILEPPLVGDDSAAGVVPLCALVVKWKGAAKGGAGRGRMFLTGFPISTTSGGFWTTDAQDPASAAASVIFDLYGPDGDASLAIINRFSNGGTPGGPQVELDPHTASLVASFSIDNVVRRQGRREVGRGV